MAIMITAEVPNQTQQGYDAMLAALEGAIRQAPGFIAHTAHPVEGGWRVIEFWESSREASDYFAKYVHPNLPPGIKPKRSTQELHSFVRP
jgi:heme-degrading monooxygenase HmoA